MLCLYFSFSSIASIILCRAGLVGMDSLWFVFTLEFFLSLSTVLYSFAEYIHLAWHLWSFRTWNTLIPGSSGLLNFSWETGGYFDSFVIVIIVLTCGFSLVPPSISPSLSYIVNASLRYSVGSLLDVCVLLVFVWIVFP